MFCLAFAVLNFSPRMPLAEDGAAKDDGEARRVAEIQQGFLQHIKPVLAKYCLRCHNATNMKSGVRVDLLNGALQDRQMFLWKAIGEMVADDVMPPEGEPQPSAAERKQLTGWIDRALSVARSRKRDKNGSIRRMTVSQYRNTLRELLKLDDDLTDTLPADGVSKDGFLNNSQTLELSPLLVEAYFDVAEKALNRCIVDVNAKPAIQNFRVDLGESINPSPCPDKLILGALSHLLDNDDFIVTELTPAKPFDFEPFRMRKEYRFIEGYQGNATVRGWREFDSIYHAVFACMRGTEGYPKGLAYQAVPEGLLLRPAIPSSELFKVESTYGPRANFKISLRELPDVGRFRVTVKAAKYDDGLLLDPGAESRPETAERAVTLSDPAKPQTVKIERAGFYQVDVYVRSAADGQVKPNGEKRKRLSLKLGDRRFAGNLTQAAFLAVRLPAGPVPVFAEYDGAAALDRVVLTPLREDDPLAKRLATFLRRSPRVGVHVGLRRDCGSTLARVGDAQTVSSPKLNDFVFEGAISNFPSPDVEKDNVNYLAGIREIGVRSEYTDGRDMPRLLVRSVEFEGPYYETWPPACAPQYLHRVSPQGQSGRLCARDYPLVRHPRVSSADYRRRRSLAGRRLERLLRRKPELSAERERRADGRTDVAAVSVPYREQRNASSGKTRRLGTRFEAFVLLVERSSGRAASKAGRGRRTARFARPGSYAHDPQPEVRAVQRPVCFAVAQP